MDDNHPPHTTAPDLRYPIGKYAPRASYTTESRAATIASIAQRPART